MAPNTLLRALGATAFLSSLASAHMQMLIPSPFRDPNADRKDEPKDYNILTPLHADGSDFACKGYQWNTPWTSVATYEAGESYNMTLKGTATHEGGSCQLSLSCDGGINFKVIKSIIGGCPLEKQYSFTIPPEFGKTSETTCLFAWTWFNKIGNREMYMNCAVVDIVPKKRTSGGGGRRPSRSSGGSRLKGRDVSHANAAAQSLLAGYPDLFVANLKNVNSCNIREAVTVVFDDPGRSLSFGAGQSESAAPSFKRGTCRGAGLNSADSAAYSSTSSTGGWKESLSTSGGQDWTWTGGDSSDQSTSVSHGDDGQWHGDSQTSQDSAWDDGQWRSQGQASWNAQQGGADAQLATAGSKPANQQEQVKANLSPVDLNEVGQQPDANVQRELDAYLAKLYGKAPSHQRRDVEDIDNHSASAYTNVNQGSVGKITSFSEIDNREQTEVTKQFEDQTSSTNGAIDYYSNINKNILYDGTNARLRRTTRQKRWESYNQDSVEPWSPKKEEEFKSEAVLKNEAASKSEAAPDTDATTEENQEAVAKSAPQASTSRSDDAFFAIIANLHNLGDTFFTLIKFASTYLDAPPPPGEFIFATVSMDNSTIAKMEKRMLIQGSAEEASHSAMLMGKLSSLQSQVSAVFQSVEKKVKSPAGVWDGLKRSLMQAVSKRQLIIPGIIPATIQNSEEFYLDGPMASVTPESDDHKEKDYSGRKPHNPPSKIAKRQEDGVGEPGDAEALFPNVSHDSLYDGLEDPSTAQPYDWGAIYPDMAQDSPGRIPAVVGPTPVTDWSSLEEESMHRGGRLPPVVGPTPVSDWSTENPGANSSDRETPSVQADDMEDFVGEEVSPGPHDGGQHNVTSSMASNTTSHALLGTTIPTPSQTVIPSAPYNDTNDKNMTLGEALKLAFPELVHHGPTDESIDPPPRSTQPKEEEDLWRDGVFPFPRQLDARQELPSLIPTPTEQPSTPNPSTSLSAEDEDLVAILPYLLAPGPVMLPGMTGVWPNPQDPEDPGKLEAMPEDIKDLTPEDSQYIQNYFSEVAAQAQPTAPPTPVSNLDSLPPLINDLTPEDESSVRAFFSSLSASAHPTPSPPPRLHARQIDLFPLTAPSPVPVSSTCAANRTALRNLLTTYQAALREPCNTTPYVQMRGPSRVQMQNALRRECKEMRKKVGSSIALVTRVLKGGCEDVEQFMVEIGV
ncbi:hypothetical protein IAQ61_009242 [Plenodomus lingam]|uniref:uncharacterized protein n=1 Tax=Leptosphaeria maculans TaxID=5022 RepID=UPI00331890E8|nr:hypothetical protein IAQ61_009242 [Plenodomus lingam]